MRKFLIAMAILVIVLPILLIVQRNSNWEIISVKEYFYLVVGFLAGFLMYDKRKKDQTKTN